MAVWGKNDTAGDEEVDEDFWRDSVGLQHGYDWKFSGTVEGGKLMGFAMLFT